ncbi:MFS multidrug transporter [Lepidopterella palustris CBS 459.81]|uniref:MFS multidrug transporter n=1 Tax=Lepidopterella palustris CBS 459.81 TaxID=1314670 RepID=A0A8E2EG67_9PEZI|nr:MFS multidrug transporter [Lepidopterella palustris CBS 459.81]
MAYFLYKYIKNKKVQRASATAEPEQFTSDIPAAHRPEIGGSKGLIDRSSNYRETSGSSSTPVTDHEEAARIKVETRRRRIYRWKMIAGLILPNFLASVDTTIVAPAVPIISSHFNHLSGGFNWIVTAYTLTLTTFVPTSGQIADIYGRHSALQFHIFCLMVGSVFCAAAQTWGMLLFGRALQGVGAAGINNLTRVVLSDNVSLADNSKNNTIFSLISGISYAIGPVIGGYLAEANWRYCFVLSIPIAFISELLIFFLMRKHLVKGRVSASNVGRWGYVFGLKTFDWPGMFFFIFGVGLIILAVMWAGTQYAWSSAAVIVPLILGGILFVTFFLHEYLLEPEHMLSRALPHTAAMIPWRLFQKRDTFLLMIINFTAGAALYSAFYIISIYWELAEGYTASKAGVQLLYYTPGIGVGVYMAMFLCNVWPRMTFYPLFFGSVIEATGIAMLTWAVDQRQTTVVNGMMALSGVGTGLRFMPVVLHAAGIWPNKLAAIMSLMSFCIPLGGTIAISMMGSVFTNKFNEYITSVAPVASQGSFNPHALQNLTIINDLPPALQGQVRHAGARAVMWAFVSIMPFMACSVVAATLLGNVWIGKAAKKGKGGEKGKEEQKGAVLYGVYLLAVLKGRADSKRQALDSVDVDGNTLPEEEKKKKKKKQDNINAV